jgi:predicted RNase H-like nuclease
MALLRRSLGVCVILPASAQAMLSRVALDDVLDAYALAIVADRRRRGLAHCLPACEPLRDAKGLRMEIWY